MTKSELNDTLDFLTGDGELDSQDGTPLYHDGPWALGYEDRASIDFLKEAFIKAKRLARFVRSKGDF